MLKKRSIVLSDATGDTNKKAVLSLEEDGVGINGRLRLYNFSFEPAGISSLGFYVDKKVYKAGLTLKGHMVYEFFLSLLQIPNKFSCAVVNFQNAQATPILYGSSDGNQDDIYGNIITEISNDSSVQNTKNVLDKFGVDFDEEEKKQIDKDIDNALCESGNCAECVYKKYFYENHKSQKFSQNVMTAQSDEKENNGSSFENNFNVIDEKEKIPQDSQKDENAQKTESEIIFFDKLKPQIDKLFENNPVEDNLQNLIPDSKWVKVEYEEDGDFFVFGLLYDDKQNVRYVCYGVPAVFDEEPPKELSGYPIWLPLDRKNEKGFGYWLTYQDATTGEPVKAILD